MLLIQLTYISQNHCELQVFWWIWGHRAKRTVLYMLPNCWVKAIPLWDARIESLTHENSTRHICAILLGIGAVGNTVCVLSYITAICYLQDTKIMSCGLRCFIFFLFFLLCCLCSIRDRLHIF